MRVGHGYDLHRLEPLAPHGTGKPFVLGGVHFDHPSGPVAHSDGDALLHAITDALLGALGMPDIGRLFPDSDAAHRDADSTIFLREAIRRMRAAGFSIGNLDCTVICEAPKIGPRRDAIVSNLANLLGCPESLINVKGKTHEKVDAVGEGRAIEVHTVVLLRRSTSSSD
ncbi:MAG: 2-C-methyl-D-erythritol 2,4-cyclodiphosphate synthase [Phycisphaerales bacterium]|nr:2-C-methyl-D-erythritol 2,4-cyclodiphosphate synthase [Phycisphaerales bacterium]